jgi:hypothetical protein
MSRSPTVHPCFGATERAQSTDDCHAWRIFAVLVFYLPIIIFEAMFGAGVKVELDKGQAGREPKVIE